MEQLCRPFGLLYFAKCKQQYTWIPACAGMTGEENNPHPRFIILSLEARIQVSNGKALYLLLKR